MTPTQSQIEQIADQFAAVLREWLTPVEFAEMKRLNETPEYAVDICASGDVCDSNMAMDAAWRRVLGDDVEINGDDDGQCAAWNAAWELARERHLGKPARVQS